MSAPTPGPWWYDAELESVFAASGPIARAEPASGPLMAAAPDLLEAAEALLNNYDRWFEAQELTPLDADGEFTTLLNGLRAAVAKARGQS